MKLTETLHKMMRVVAALAVTTAVFLPTQSQAALKCQELTAKRYCSDSTPKQYEYAPGQTTAIAAPVIAGFPSACWNWNRTFQCIESDPKYSCDSGTAYDTVKRDCNLVASVTKATTTINGITYLTDADYTYRCAFGAFTTNDQLPSNKECVQLDSNTTQSNFGSAAPAGSNPGSPLSDSLALTETRVDDYVCYSPPATTCATTCFNEVYNSTKKIMEKVAVPCTETVSSCTTTSSQCTGTASAGADGQMSSNPSLGPDGRCIASETESLCQAGTTPKCLTGKDNCQLTGTSPSGIQDNGFATLQDQTYTCTNETKTCTELANVSNCMHVGAWGWDNLAIKSQAGQGLGEFNQAMSKLEGVQKGMKEDDPYIFSGKDLRCHYAVGNFLNTFIVIAIIAVTMIATGGASVGLLSSALQSTTIMGSAAMTATAANAVAAGIQVGAAALQDAPNSAAMGANCCKEFVFEGSDAWYKLGACTGDEIRLSVAKRKGLTHYLGEYCSKKAGFPVKQCVEKTRSYCAFDDMLALVVNEQGRAQLDALALADPTSTKATAPMNISLFGTPVSSPTQYTNQLNTGKWVKRTSFNQSQVWTWEYPAYCLTQPTQKAAYDLWMTELSSRTDTKGIEPKEMTPQQAATLLAKAISIAPFQECATTPGTMSYLTCSKADDSCDATKLPEGPTGVETDLSGSNVSEADVNWRVQQSASYYALGDYGVSAAMPSDGTFAAVTSSVSEYISAVGSCKESSGVCLYYFAITDKKSSGGGAKKRATEYAQFPLYTGFQSTTRPAVDYVALDGTLNTEAYNADPNRGLANPTIVGTQRLIFHPNYSTRATQTELHSKLLVEYANRKISEATPQNDYSPLMVPTTLPIGTPGWYPYGNTSVPGQYFYLSGGCDPNSRWCNYKVEVDLQIPRHPWGSAQSPRCWGFSLDQMAALDFDKMDLSRWINSLDLSAASTGLSADAAKAMTDRVTNTAQSFYTAMKDGASTTKSGAGTTALITSTDVLPKLSNADFEAFKLEIGVPSNWPNYFTDQPNNNPVTNVEVDWGDKSPGEKLTIHPEGRAYIASHDYGDKPVGRYKISVTLNTAANGPQTLTKYISITPDKGGKPVEGNLDFNNPGVNGKVQGDYKPSEATNGMNQSQSGLQTVAPGMTDQFSRQGTSVGTQPTPGP